jgi:predicted GNAT superfamily acetyltransferase
MTPVPPSIEPIGQVDLAAALALNNAHAQELSWLDQDGLSRLVGNAFAAWRIGHAEAMLIAFDQGADYGSPNFLWFRERHAAFVYVDRVVVAETARGRGHARRLYEALFDTAARRGHRIVTCEVNSAPPNPASDAFHAALGFAIVGSATLGPGKSVRYYERTLA